MRIAGILLAAGHSRRFSHGNKLLYPLKDGLPTALVAARNLVAALPHSLAVVRPQTTELAERLSDAGLEVLICQPEQQEMGDSLSAAVRHLVFSQTPPDAIVVALADMPFILPHIITAITERLSTGAPIVAPIYQGMRGHPVGFSKRFYPALATLTGDEGARSVLRRHVEEMELLECDDPGILQDIDTWEQLQRYLPDK